MNNSVQWASLHGHSHHSLLDGISKPIDIISRCVDVGIPAVSLTDHGNCAGVISFQKSRKKYIEKIQAEIFRSDDQQVKDSLSRKIESAKKLKLILGIEMYIADGEKKNSHLVVLAKNKLGYQQMIKMVSEASRKENFFRKPRLSLDKIANFTTGGNLISFNGHPGSSLNNCIWVDLNAAFKAKTYEEAKSLVHKDWEQRVSTLADMHRQVFGQGNFWIEIQIIDAVRLPMELVAAKILRHVGKKLGIPCVATADSHYPTQNRCEDQRISLCNLLRKTLPQIQRDLVEDEDDVGLAGFFQSNKYYIPSPEEMISLHTENEIQASLDISSMCEEYDLSNKPLIPKFDCPGGITSDEYFRQICRKGWAEKLSHLTGDERTTYANRVKHELSILEEAGLSDYMLLIWDIINWVKQSGGLVGCGRGSVGGVLSAYLAGITSIDSIEYNLLFERFYNAGRNTSTHTSLPDVDMDIQSSFKEKVENYIRNKYGHSKVGKISTYSRLMGRSCLSDVLRAHEALPFAEIKRCTSFIPDESAIADDLQEMREDEGDSSVILWSLQNSNKELSEWCYLDDNGKCQGPLAKYFEQAMRIEGTYRSQGEHAAGVVIFPDDIENIAPVMYDKDGDCVITFDMHAIEYVGGVKMDVLGVTVLDKAAYSQNLITKGFLRNEKILQVNKAE